jgi:hypothetical protein
MAAHHLAKGLAALGRNGDSMLVHMQPHEVAGLQAIAKLQGKSLTRNPHTGLPEAFDLGSFFTSFLPLAAGIALAPETGGASLGLTGTAAQAAPIVGGALTGAGVSAMKGEDPLMGGFMGGLGGYGGSQIGSSLANFGGASAATPAAENATGAWQAEMANGAGTNAPFMPPAAPSYAPSASMSPVQGLESGSFGPNFGLAPDTAGGYIPGTAMEPTTLAAPVGQEAGTNYLAQGAQRAFNDPSAYIDTIKGGGMGAAKMYGLPLAGAALSGLEPTDIYGEPLKSAPHKKIPTLNLSDASYPGLNLNTNYASGGTITPGSGGLNDLYSTSDDSTRSAALSQDGYGLGRLSRMSDAATPQGFAHGGYLNGPGDGMSDSIPATIEGRQPARLADGEFVVPADVVSHIGNGSSKAGSDRLYSMLDKIRKARTGHTKQGKQINPNKYLPG